MAKIYDATSSISQNSKKFGEIGTALRKMRWSSSMPSDIVRIVAAEIDDLEESMEGLNMDLGRARLKPLVDGLMGCQGQRTVVVRPEAVNMHLNVTVEMDAQELSRTMYRSIRGTYDGYFQLTPSARIRESAAGYPAWSLYT